MDSAQRLVLPQRTLLVLCGVAGAGKSTFAHTFVEEHFAHGLRTTSVVSSDYCRALVCDDEANQQVSRDAFDLLYYITQKRMLQDRFTIVDSTALLAQTRHHLLDIARHRHYGTCLLVFNTSLATCLQHDRARTRVVGAEVIAYQETLLQRTLLEIPNEGWQYIYVVEEGERPRLTIQ